MISCPHCGETVITETERIQAKDILVKLSHVFKRQDIASMLKINPIYVSFAKGMTEKDDGCYICPSPAIIKIIQWAANNKQIP